MPTVQDILISKGTQVQTVEPSATATDAIRKMNQHKIGALLVMNGEHVEGIFTERDVLRRVVGQDRTPTEIGVADVMTKDVICVEPEMDLDDVATIMKEKKIRHLPVCDGDGKLHGMISIGDLNAYHASNQEATIHFLHEYIYGRA
ncbi:MAG TPA: CBS domain-containing protein [Tepidisphaeraceae bacterium]|jgi:CBS domain-containing protein